MQFLVSTRFALYHNGDTKMFTRTAPKNVNVLHQGGCKKVHVLHQGVNFCSVKVHSIIFQQMPNALGWKIDIKCF